jgi:hypothetical protein
MILSVSFNTFIVRIAKKDSTVIRLEWATTLSLVPSVNSAQQESSTKVWMLLILQNLLGTQIQSLAFQVLTIQLRMLPQSLIACPVLLESTARVKLLTLRVEIVSQATFAKLGHLNNNLLFQIVVLTKSGVIVLKGLIVLLVLLIRLLVHQVHMELQQLCKL